MTLIISSLQVTFAADAYHKAMLIRTGTQEDTIFVALTRFSMWNDCSMTAQAKMVHQAVLQLRVHPKILM